MEDDETPDWRLRCTLHRLRIEPSVPRSAAVVFIGSATTILAGLVAYGLGASDFVLAMTVVGLLFATLGLSFCCWRRDRGMLSVFPERMVVQRIKAGKPGEHWSVNYTSICRISRTRRSISIWSEQGQFARMRIGPLHIEDVFDSLAERIASANPDCVIVEA